jgi:hypothetical protein
MRYREITLQRLAALEKQMDTVTLLLREIATTLGVESAPPETTQNAPVTKDNVIPGQTSLIPKKNTP